ncbi:MAG: MBL fold metallo-hydrolase [Candidatus Pacebacteria bacterium]|nr:MBL fold metallo-hydrolase [Candidatus Paceibacterota bacterium]
MDDILSPKEIKKIAINIVFLISLLITGLSGWFQIISNENKGNLKVSFLDVGQGDSIFIEAPNKMQIIIDTGPNAKVLQSLNDQISFFDESIDAVVLTHPDLDHIGGTIDLFNSYDVPLIMFATSTKETDATIEISNLDVERREVKDGDIIMLDSEKNIYLEILSPDNEKISVDSNDQSIVAKLIYGETCFILTGDASKEVEMKIVKKYGDKIKCDVLKVGHHGSHTSSEEKFVGFVSPKFAIISAGKDNKYGHPHKETIDTLLKFNVEILNTADLGNITFFSDGSNVYLDKSH